MKNKRFKWMAIGSIISIVALAGIAYAFDDRTTNRAIAAGDGQLKRCKTIQVEKQKIDCVAKALDTTASSIRHQGPGYQYIKRKLRSTAASVRGKRKKSRARAVLAAAAAVLRKAWTRPVYAGPKQLAKKHFARFAAFVNRAKSVLRS